MWTETTREQYRRDNLHYASDTSDAEWLLLSFFLPAPCHLGRPREVDLRMVMNAILYLLGDRLSVACVAKGVSAAPPTVQHYFYMWRDQRIWSADQSRPCAPSARTAAGRNAVPSCRRHRQPERPDHGKRLAHVVCFAARQRVKGRKRHMITDTQGFLLALLVHEANIQDNHGAVPLLGSLRQTFPSSGTYLLIASTAAPSSAMRSPPSADGRSRSSPDPKASAGSSLSPNAG